MTTLYRTASARFIESDTVIEGEPCRVITDPILGVYLAVPVAQAAMLRYLFRPHWLRAATAPGTRH